MQTIKGPCTLLALAAQALEPRTGLGVTALAAEADGSGALCGSKPRAACHGRRPASAGGNGRAGMDDLSALPPASPHARDWCPGGGVLLPARHGRSPASRCVSEPCAISGPSDVRPPPVADANRVNVQEIRLCRPRAEREPR